MSGLILKLGPNERVLINGAVIQNGERRAKISIRSKNANVLRLKDAIHPDQASTPVTRACYIAQLVLSGDAQPADGRQQLLIAIEQLSQVFEDRDSRTLLADATQQVVNGDAYRAMRILRELIPREARLLALRDNDV